MNFRKCSRETDQWTVNSFQFEQQASSSVTVFFSLSRKEFFIIIFLLQLHVKMIFKLEKKFEKKQKPFALFLIAITLCFLWILGTVLIFFIYSSDCSCCCCWYNRNQPNKQIFGWEGVNNSEKLFDCIPISKK